MPQIPGGLLHATNRREGSRPTKLMVSKTSPLSTPIADIGADIVFRRFGPILLKKSSVATHEVP
jgi:hypothetical protein